MNKEILRIAVPSIVSNITVPLLSLVDMGLSGHLGATAYIGATAVGAMVFNMLYWLCGFLRMGTGGFTAQAFGRSDWEGARGILLRALCLAAGLGLAFILLQQPLADVSFALMGSSAEVEALARQYFSILIWGAPASLAVFCLNGWYLGMQNARVPMAVAISQNLVNIVLSAWLVAGMGWKVEGIATGTLVAQYAGLLLYMAAAVPRTDGRRVAGCLAAYVCGGLRRWRKVRPSGGGRALAREVGADFTLFLRTLCLVAVQVAFMASGAAQGDVVLAVNSLLMQFFTLFSYFMDGFAYAGEALGGRFYGAGDRLQLRRLVRHLFLWGGSLVVVFTVLYAAGGALFMQLLTSDAVVIAAAASYFPYVLLLPLCGCAAFLYDGLCIGTTSLRLMLLSVGLAALVFFCINGLLPAAAAIGANHCLWAAMLAFLAVRGLVQAVGFRSCIRPMPGGSC